MATYTTQSIDTVGTLITYTAVTAADRFLPNDDGFIHVKNGSGVTVTVTMVTPNTVDGLAIADRSITLAAGVDRMIAIPNFLYRSSDGLGDVTFSPITTVTAAVIAA